jgi:hypothetical protein
VSNAGQVIAVAVLVTLTSAVAPTTEARPPLRIGVSPSLTGTYDAIGQNLPSGRR